MRILHLIPSLTTGGAETQLCYLSEKFAKAGHDVHIAYHLQNQASRTPAGVKLHHLSVRSNYDPLLLLKIIRLIKRTKPDILHSWALQMDILGYLASKICGIKWLFREASSQKAYDFTSIKYKIREKLAQYADCIVANSEAGLDYWRNRAPATRLELIHNGLPLEFIDSIRPDRSCLPEFARPAQIPLILYAGRLAAEISAQKNVDQLLRSLLQIKAQNFVCLICGDGPHKKHLQNLSMALNLTGKVIFTGSLPQIELWQLMKEASVFVSLSAFEGHPNTVLEAMACNCPMVLSDIEAHRSILDDRSAIFVNQDIANEVSAAINISLTDRRSAEQRAMRAHSLVNKFSVSEMTAKYESLYLSMIDSR